MTPLSLAMSEEMRRDENVLLMGEDVGVFGGDFGTSVGMLKNLAQNVFVTVRFLKQPSLEQQQERLLRPIVDMTFMDFSVIAMDNIVNQAAKTRYMFGGGKVRFQ